MPRNNITALMLAGIVLNCTTAQAQRAQCESCMTLTPVVELSTADGPILPSLVQSVLRTHDGRWLISHLFREQPQFAVYDGAGRFLELHGRAGEGPGEFRYPPRLYTGPGNTIWASDDARLIRLDERLRHIATKNLGKLLVASRTVVLPNGAVAINSRDTAAEGGFYTVSLMDSSGSIMRRLEREPEAYSTTIIAPAIPDGFWAVRTNQLQLRRYSSRGEVMRSVTMLMDHFQPWQGKAASQGVEGFDFPSRPRHFGLIDVGNDRIVVVTMVADTQWKAMPSNRAFRPSERDNNRQYDTLLTLVDLRTGRTLVTSRLPEFLQVVNGASDLLHTVRMDNDGHVITRIVRLQTGRGGT